MKIQKKNIAKKSSLVGFFCGANFCQNAKNQIKSEISSLIFFLLSKNILQFCQKN
jgi:hypothetical protein